MSIGHDPEQHVGHGDVLELALLRVGEVDLGLPDGLDEVGVVEVEGLLDGVVVEAGVLPVLTEVEVDLVVLEDMCNDLMKFQSPLPGLMLSAEWRRVWSGGKN